MILRKRTVCRMARELLAKHNVTAAPVDVCGIAGAEGITVIVGDLAPDLSGFLYRDGHSVLLGVSAENRLERQRFTIGHELGHFFLHDEQSVFVDEAPSTLRFRNADSSTGVDVDEREANLFSAELLMPADFIRRDVAASEATDPEHLVADMARKYQVSREAMLIRLTGLGYVEQ